MNDSARKRASKWDLKEGPQEEVKTEFSVRHKRIKDAGIGYECAELLSSVQDNSKLKRLKCSKKVLSSAQDNSKLKRLKRSKKVVSDVSNVHNIHPQSHCPSGSTS